MFRPASRFLSLASQEQLDGEQPSLWADARLKQVIQIQFEAERRLANKARCISKRELDAVAAVTLQTTRVSLSHDTTFHA